jgi:hypothetical protein
MLKPDTAPAHAIYFTTYEVAKKQMGITVRDTDHKPVHVALAGFAATVIHCCVECVLKTAYR